MLYEQTGRRAHAVVPYSITYTGGNTYDLLVYDSNYPQSDARKIRFDLNTESWTYTTMAPGSSQAITLSSRSDGTSFLDLRHLSGHRRSGLQIIGAESAATVFARASSEAPARLFQAGQPVAFRAEGCLVLEGGAEFNSPPDANGDCYELPSSGGVTCLRDGGGTSSQNQLCSVSGGVNSNLEFTLHPDQQADHALMLLTDVGNVVGVRSSNMESTTDTLGVDITPDAKGVAVTADGSSGIAPELSFAVRGATAVQPGYLSQVSGMALSAGKTISTEFDTAIGRFYFGDDDPGDLSYDVEIERLNPDGTDDLFLHTGLVLTGTAAYLDFGNWTGGGAPMDLYVDDEGDGFADEQPRPLTNERNTVYLPLVLRNS